MIESIAAAAKAIAETAATVAETAKTSVEAIAAKLNPGEFIDIKELGDAKSVSDVGHDPHKFINLKEYRDNLQSLNADAKSVGGVGHDPHKFIDLKEYRDNLQSLNADAKSAGGVGHDPHKFIDLKEYRDNLRPLTAEEKNALTKDCNTTANIAENARIDENGVYHIKTINESREGTTGSDGVKYERKTVEINNHKIEGVFPQFESKFDTQLPEDLMNAPSSKQFQFCIEKLKEAIDKNPDLAMQFSPEQLKQIELGEKPEGTTWHHNENYGKMQLVDASIHNANRHTGGNAIWSSGS